MPVIRHEQIAEERLMSAHDRADSLQRGRHDGPPATGGDFGLSAATALVIGSVIGTGVFALPATGEQGPMALPSGPSALGSAAPHAAV